MAQRRILVRALVTLGILAAVVVALGLIAPGFVRTKLNDSLANMPGGYRGTVKEVDFELLELGIVLKDFQIEKRDGSVKTPYLEARALEAKVVRGVERFRPELELRFLSPRINLVDAEAKAQTQFGPDITLADLAQKLPLDLRRFAIVEGEVHLRHFQAEPPVDAYVSHLNVQGDELSRCLPPAGACSAKFVVRGRPMGHAALFLKGELSHRDAWTGDAHANLTNLHLASLTPLLSKYAEIDVKKGEAALKADVHLRGRRYFGSLRPELDDVDVLGKDGGQRRFGRELVAGVASHFVEKRSGRMTIHFAGTKGADDLTFDIDVADRASASAQDGEP